MSLGLAEDMKPEVLMELYPGEEPNAVVDAFPFERTRAGEKADAVPEERAKRARILNFMIFHRLDTMEGLMNETKGGQ